VLRNPENGSNNPSEIPADTAGWKLVLRALKYKNYRLFFGGQSVSLVGMWMQSIAMSWLVYRLTNSAILLGVIGFVNQIPSFILSPIAGVYADRWDRRYMLICTQALLMLQSLTLAVLVLSGVAAVWHLIALAFFSGIINAFDAPARQSFLVDIIERKEDFGNAIALNSAIFNGARLIGPSLAGIIIAATGEGICFLINGLSYLAIISALMAMHINPKEHAVQNSHVLQELKDGFSYVCNHISIRSLLILVALVSLVGMPYVVLMPIFAKEILGGGPSTLGFLMAASGIGALTGAFFLASRRDFKGTGRLIPVAATIFGSGLVAFSFSSIFIYSFALMLMTGFGLMVQMALSNTSLQTIVDDDKRGRVMSFYTMSFMGMAPFGSLLAGGLAHRIGAPNTLLIGGLACVAGALLCARNIPAFRKINVNNRVRGFKDSSD
jgi:MFS family permease